MDIRQMRYFMEICRLGSVSRAAESMFVSQQGLSSSIRRLEQELDCALFYRKGNSLVLTENGQYFLDNSIEIVNAFDKLQNHFRNLGTEENAKVSVLCVYSVISKGPRMLQQALLDGVEGLNVSIGECYTAECPELLDNNAYNFAICYEQDWANRYDTHFLFPVEHCFMVHRSHPLAKFDSIAIPQLDGQRMIFPQRKTAIWGVMNDLLRTQRVHPIDVFETNQALEISSMLMHDHSLVARVTYGDALALNNADLKILRVRDVPFMTRAVLVHRRDLPLTSNEQRFQDTILKAAFS